MSSAAPNTTLLALSDQPNGGASTSSRQGVSKEPFFRSVQWSADGTTLFTNSSTDRFSAYVLPPNLLEPHGTPVPLQPHGTLQFAEPTYELAPCPAFALESPETHLVLAATRDHPVHLYPVFSSSADDDLSAAPPRPLAHYNLIKMQTEQYLPVRSLLWPGAGTHFLAGTRDLVAVFDVSRPEPVLSIKTIPSKRHRSAGHGIGMRGTVSALSAQPAQDGSSSLVAAGTWQRSIALYDLLRAGEVVGTWGVRDAAPEVGGDGIVQTTWSPCGNYLIINERQSTGLLVYDLRTTKKLLATLTGREANTHQKVKCDVFSGTADKGGFEVWSGTQGGAIKVWEGVGNAEGAVEPSWQWQGHPSLVNSTALHSCGSVVATCSGEWKISDELYGPQSKTTLTPTSTTDGDSTMDDSDSSSDQSSGSPTSSSTDSDSSDDETSSAAETEATPRLQGRVVVEESTLKIWSIGSTSIGTSGQDHAESFA